MNTPLSADVVVIGAGICGALLARKLSLAGHAVLMLESGPRVGRAELVERNQSARARSASSATATSVLSTHRSGSISRTPRRWRR